jgi:2-amino-4-hydroxy-6-hydroxymethyldihydropteridine diphosphokinase
MARAVLALGANIGDPATQLEKAIEAISAHPDITLTARSSVIITPPWGVTDQNEFHNAAVLVDTALTPEALLSFCLATEGELGRVRAQKWGPRVIDIDVIAYDRLEMDSDTLTLPHPYAHERDFVLVPVREIAPDVAAWLVNRNMKAGA